MSKLNYVFDLTTGVLRKSSILLDRSFNLKSINLKGLKYTLKPIDYKSLTSKVTPMEPTNGFYLPFKIGEKSVGSMAYHISNDLGIYNKKLLPCWKNLDGSNKPFLWVDLIEVIKKMNGIGREAFKMLYLKSVEKGCGGRIACETSYHSEKFYEQLGFEMVGSHLPISEITIKRTFDRLLKSKERISELKLKQNLSQQEEFELNYRLKWVKEFPQYMRDLANRRKINPEATIIFNPTEENIRRLFKLF